MTDNFYNNFRAGFNFFEKKDYQNAIESLLKAKMINPDDCNVHYYLGESCLNLGDMRKAIQAYTVGLLLCPDDVEIKNALIQVAPNYTPSNKEEHDLRNEILLNPDDVSNYFGLAGNLQCNYDDASLNESIELFETIIHKFPQNTDAYMLLGMSYDDKGMTDEAIELNEKAIRIDPNYDQINEIFFHLDREYKLKGNFSKMINKYQKLLLEERNKNDISYRFALAEAYLNNGELWYAKDEFNLLVKGPFDKRYPFFKNKLKEIEDKIKKINSTEEKVKEFERKFRKFIKTIFLRNNREICKSIEDTELISKIQLRIQTQIEKKPSLKKDDLNPLDFFDFLDYYKLIAKNWDIFKRSFSSKDRLNRHIEYINDFRNQVAHNRIVDYSALKFCDAALIWFNEMLSIDK